jgi:hypothetical protein
MNSDNSDKVARLTQSIGTSQTGAYEDYWLGWLLAGSGK